MRSLVGVGAVAQGEGGAGMAGCLWRGAGYRPASRNSVTHGRDLAWAPANPPSGLKPGRAGLAFARTQLSTIPRTGRFSPAQTDADDAPAIDRLSPSSTLWQLGSTS